MERNQFCYYLHGSSISDSKEIADVFENGLATAYGTSMHSTLFPLKQQRGKKFDLDSEVKKYFGNSNDYHSVFVIKVPKQYMGQTLHKDGSVDIAMPLFRQTAKECRFVPNFIVGVVTKDGAALSNPNFNIIYDPNGLAYADEQLRTMEGLLGASPQAAMMARFMQLRCGKTYGQLKKQDKEYKVFENAEQYYKDLLGTESKKAAKANGKEIQL